MGNMIIIRKKKRTGGLAMSIGLSFEAQIQDVSEAREEVMDLAEQWNIAAFPDENSVSLSFCPIGILEINLNRKKPITGLCQASA